MIAIQRTLIRMNNIFFNRIATRIVRLLNNFQMFFELLSKCAKLMVISIVEKYLGSFYGFTILHYMRIKQEKK